MEASVRGRVDEQISSQKITNMKTPIHKQTALRGILTAATLLASLSSAFANNAYYVDPVNGNDSYNGLQPTIALTSGPKQSVQAAFDATSAGDIIYLRGGTHRASLTGPTVLALNKSGEKLPDGRELPITIMAYPGEIPVLKGSQIASDGDPATTADEWTHITNQEWTAAGGSGAAPGVYKRSWIPSAPIATRYPQQVFVSPSKATAETTDGVSLNQIHWIGIPGSTGWSTGVNYIGSNGTLKDMTAGSFYYDATTSILYTWIASSADPNGKFLEVSTCRTIIEPAPNRV